MDPERRDDNSNRDTSNTSSSADMTAGRSIVSQPIALNTPISANTSPVPLDVAASLIFNQPGSPNEDSSSSGRPQFPLVPLPVLPNGKLEIDDEQSCVVYTAPIATFTMERLLLTQQIKDKQRRKVAPIGVKPGSPVKLTALPSYAQRVMSAYNMSQAIPFPSPNGRLPSLSSPREKENGDEIEAEEQPMSGEEVLRIDGDDPLKPAVASSLRNKELGTGSIDYSIQKLRQRVKFLPLDEEDKREFLERMERTSEERRKASKTMMNDDNSPMAFNRDAAGDKSLLDERHETWVDQHHARLIFTRENKVVEDKKYIQRMIETSSAYRNQLRESKRQVNERNALCQSVLPSIYLLAFTGRMMEMLQKEWTLRRRIFHLQKFLCMWNQKRKKRSSIEKNALLLIYWLQKCVAVRSVGFRVFAAVRLYLRKVKRVQQLWRVRCARRARRLAYVEELWVEHETRLVDAAAEEFERQQQLNRERGGRRQKKSKAVFDDPGVTLSLVPQAIRARIIKEFLDQHERSAVERSRQLESEFFPHLVQTLRCEFPDKSRGYIRERAKNCALLGRVVSTLRRIPNAIGPDQIPPPEPFSIEPDTLDALIRQGREEATAGEQK